jgi:hypothetical protein
LYQSASHPTQRRYNPEPATPPWAITCAIAMPSVPHATWSLVNHVAAQRSRDAHDGVALELDLRRPERGLTVAIRDGHRDHLLGVGVASAAADGPTGPLTDHWLRGSDLTAVYEPADPRRLRATSMWRIHEARDDVACWEVVVSAQTSLPESDAALAVITDIETDELLWSAARAPLSPWRRLDSRAPVPDEAAWILARRGDATGGTSVLIATHPADRRRIKIRNVAGRARIECWLFPTAIEKGVLLRSRVLGAIGPRPTDETWASRTAATFAASPPPLTT